MSDNGGRSPRNTTIDIARALVVIGVVFNHSIDGLTAAGILIPSSPAVVANDALYVFRMPALAFMLGLFIPGGIAKRGQRGYVRERVTLGVYLYVVWFFVQTLAEIATSNIKNSPRNWVDLLQIWSVPAHLWFLLYLAVSAIVMAVLLPLLRGRGQWVPLTILVPICIACWGCNPPVFGMRGLSLLVFTFAGAAIGLGPLCASVARFPGRWIIGGTAAAVAFVPVFNLGTVPSTLNGEDHSVFVSATSAVGAALGVLIVLGLAVALSYIPLLSNVLARTGKSTLEIYLAHVALVAGVRVFLGILGVQVPALFIVASVIIGVALPILAASIAPHVRMGWLFRPPAPLQTWSEAANRAPAETSRLAT